jgi:N-acetylmuramoyl-L-alanine amidase
MTRTEDVLLYDRGADYEGRKKVLDLAARLAIADETEDSLLVSIHMNAFPQTQYSGMQVWYGTADARSREIAQSVQSAALTLRPDNNRQIKAAGSNIFLLDNLDTPAILVECGFLSNPEEASRLGDEEYQKQLAFVIFGAIAEYIQ